MSNTKLFENYMANCQHLLNYRAGRKLANVEPSRTTELLNNHFVYYNLGNEWIILMNNGKVSMTLLRTVLEKAKKQVKGINPTVLIILDLQDRTDHAADSINSEAAAIFSGANVYVYGYNLVTFNLPSRPDFREVRVLTADELQACKSLSMEPKKFAGISRHDPMLLWHGSFTPETFLMITGPSLNSDRNVWYRQVRNK